MQTQKEAALSQLSAFTWVESPYSCCYLTKTSSVIPGCAVGPCPALMPILMADAASPLLLPVFHPAVGVLVAGPCSNFQWSSGALQAIAVQQCFPALC